MKLLPAILFFLFCSLTAYTQNFSISGKVTDEQQHPIPFASVAIHAAADSSLVGGNISDDQGTFNISVKPGNYFLKITFLSYTEKTIAGIVVADADVSVGTIFLKPSANMLKEVVIQGEKAQMELQLDKRIFNVSEDLGKCRCECRRYTRQSSSVNVDVDGTVSLRGSEKCKDPYQRKTFWFNEP
jgi:hypothetical protein